MKNINKNSLAIYMALAYSLYLSINTFLIKLPGLIPSILLLIGLAAGVNVILKCNQSFQIIKTRILIMDLLILSVATSTALQIATLENKVDINGNSTFSFLLNTTITGFVWLAIGAGMQKYNFYTSIGKSTFILGTLLLCIFPNIENNYLVNWVNLQNKNELSVDIGHLSAGYTFSLMIFYIYVISPRLIRFPIYIMGIFILFSLGGRTTLICYIITIILHNIFFKSIKKMYALLSAALIAGTIILVSYSNDISNDPLLQRMLLVGGVDQDESKIARDQFLSDGIKYLPDQFLFGNVNVFYNNYNSFGTYIHNIISAWQIYGFIPFLLFCIAIIFIGNTIRKLRDHKNDLTVEFGLIIYTYSVLSLISGKYIGFPMFWFSLGFWLIRSTSPKEGLNNPC